LALQKITLRARNKIDREMSVHAIDAIFLSSNNIAKNIKNNKTIVERIKAWRLKSRLLENRAESKKEVNKKHSGVNKNLNFLILLISSPLEKM